MLGISDVVLFGIKSGLKLAHQRRQAFIDETISRKLVVPLLEFDSSFTLGSANQFFRSPAGQAQLDLHPTLNALFEKANNFESLGEDEHAYINAAFEFRLLENIQLSNNSDAPEDASNLTDGQITSVGFNSNALKSIVTVQQFSRFHKPDSPSSFQRVLGSLIEIGVDAFSKFPGIIDTESAAGRAVSGFLNAIDDLDFKTQHVDILAQSLFISVIETLGENADLLGADAKIESLIKSVSSGLIKDLTSRINSLENNLIEREDVSRWGNLVLRSVLGNVQQTVLANPKSLGIDNPAHQALISSVGTTILGAILDESNINLRALFSKQGLDQVVKASLNTVSEFPELLGANGEGLRKIIAQISQGLADNEHILNRDMLPDTIRLIIEKTAQNANFLWPEGFKNQGRHLLVTASTEFLIQFFSVPESSQTWRPAFSKSQLIGLLDLVLEETIQNPNWVAKLETADHTIIGQATSITLEILQTVPANQLSLETAEKILRSVISAVSNRLDFLEILEIAEERAPRLATALKAIVSALLSQDLDPKILWVMARGEVFSTIIDTALGVLSQIGITEETINRVLDVLSKAKESILEGGRWVLNEVLDELKNLATIPAT